MRPTRDRFEFPLAPFFFDHVAPDNLMNCFRFPIRFSSRRGSRPSFSRSPKTIGRLTLVVVVLLAVGCQSQKWATIREVPQNSLTQRLNLFYGDKWKPSERTVQVLRLYDLEKHLDADDYRPVLEAFEPIVEREPTREKHLAFAELAYLAASKLKNSDPPAAVDLFARSGLHAYQYLFDSRSHDPLNPYDPQFREACDFYNGSQEAILRIVSTEKKIQPGKTYTIRTGSRDWTLRVEIQGDRWKNEDFDHFEFVSDYNLTGLRNHYRTFGMGVPLIAVRKSYEGQSPDARYYPIDLSFPVTALFRPNVEKVGAENIGAGKTDANQDGPNQCDAVLEIYDPLAITDIAINQFRVPLESDLSVPLAHFLSKPQLEQLATAGLLKPDVLLKKIDPAREAPIMGLYMFEPYQPGKIPVLMVHGLWSSPITWVEMFNDLRNDPQIRDKYQFWFYLYPTGQPFWFSASMLRQDLVEARGRIDPNHGDAALDQMVLIGHSMGGLVSRLQTLNSGEDFWHLVSDEPFSKVDAEPTVKKQLARTFFFRPSPSIRRVITIGTPHRGSQFSNDVTRWLTSKLISLPGWMNLGKEDFIAQNKSVFRDTRFFNIETSIDSLSPGSPFFTKMVEGQRAPWVKYHNVLGLVPKQGLFGKMAAGTDGVVSKESAHMDDVESELIVEADHTTVHAHPQTVQEIRRILFVHMDELRHFPANPPIHVARQKKAPSEETISMATQGPVVPVGHVSAQSVSENGQAVQPAVDTSAKTAPLMTLQRRAAVE